MLHDFLLNLAANLAWEWLHAISHRLRDLGFGDAESRALQRAFQEAFEAMLSQTAAHLDAEQQRHLESVLRPFIGDQEVAGMLLDAVLRRQSLPLSPLRERLAAFGLDETTLSISLDSALTVFGQMLAETLQQEAGRPESPLFNRLMVARVGEIARQLEQILPKVNTLADLREQIERALGQRAVSITGGVSGSIIITGDGNQVVIADGGSLAQRWQELQMGDAEAADLYRERIANLYAHLTFPLSGISFDTLLHEVYQPLQAAPVDDRNLTNWHLAERAAPDRRQETDELLEEGQPVALLGLLGGGKTTTLHYLTWSYARRPDDSLLWRGDELLPFYVTARDLAATWQGDTEFTPACARAVTRARGHPPFSAYLAQRVLEWALQQGIALLLVDALDEYRVADTPRSDFLRSLLSTWQSEPFGRNLLLLTSRPHAYLAQKELRAYALQALEDPRVEHLAYRLGKVLLRERSENEAEQHAKLRDLTRLVVSPPMRELTSPFYITLLTLGICRSDHFADGLAEARGIGRLADLYRFFLRQTIRWEQAKPDAPAIDERAAMLALAELGWQTFVEPPWQERLAPELLPNADRRAALAFWQRTGLVQEDPFTGERQFYHTGFQLFGVALMLNEAWGRGRQDEVRRLHQETARLTDWDTIWQLFFGLRGGGA